MDTENIGEYKVSVTFHSGRYGPENCKGDVISTVMKCNNSQDIPSTNKEIIFVVDCSASMNDSLPNLKAGLLAFRDIVINRNPINDLRTSHEIERDFCSVCNTTLIIYNDDSQEVYSSTNETHDWDESVGSIYTRGMTNMGDAVELAYSKSDSNKCTWIILMTDGIPNKGRYQTSSSFGLLKKNEPKNTRFVTLGYGKEYDSKVLMSLGEFTAVESIEYIPSVFGSIANELKNTWGFGAKWRLRTSLPGSKYIVGSPNIGCMYDQREYITGILLESVPENLSEIYMEFNFISVQTMVQEWTLILVRNSYFPLSDHFREKYYCSAKGRRMIRLYHASQRANVYPLECDTIKKEIDEWTEDCALPHKEELLRMIEEFDHLSHSGSTNCDGYENVRHTAATRYIDTKRQSSHIITGEMTFSQSEMIKESYKASLSYTMDDSD